MSDDFTEIAHTRLSKRQQQRAAGHAETAADPGSGDDETVLGSRRRPVPSPVVGAPTIPAAPMTHAAPTRGDAAPPPTAKGRLANAPALPGSPAAREHYRPRVSAPVIAARQGTNTNTNTRDRAPASSAPRAIDHAAHLRATRARARRRALWLVVAITGTLLLLSAGILLVVSTLGR